VFAWGFMPPARYAGLSGSPLPDPIPLINAWAIFMHAFRSRLWINPRLEIDSHSIFWQYARTCGRFWMCS